MQPVEQYGLAPDQFEELFLEPEVDEVDTDDAWLSLARDAFRTSDTYFASSLSKQAERNISMFNSRHVSGSKYYTEGYKYRSKIFRPKVRSSIRRHEAASAVAFFSTDDIILCEPEYQADEMSRLGALLAERLINYRLNRPEMAWFQTIIGAYQDAMVQGVAISRQEWKYKVVEGEVVEDRPACTLVPIENFRFDPNADWRNPVATSPYLIEMIPMYRGDVLRKASGQEKNSAIVWREIDVDLLSKEESYSSAGARKQRDDERTDKADQKHEHSEYDIIWVHRNIIDMEGVDFIYYTLGTTLLLTDPVPLRQVFANGRPYVAGFCNIETHKTPPASLVQMSEGLQKEINDIANQRLDNVKLVVNRRSFVRRNAKIDTRSLTHSVPGGVTLVDDINQDIRYDAPPDITGSSYAEQDRLNADFDDLAGSFSSGSVQTNKAMNETVGGMQLMSADANSVTEYQLRIFSETWVKPVIKQLVHLERFYETDMKVLETVAPGLAPEEAIQLLQQDIKVRVSVGFGSINPQQRVEKLAFALNTVGQFMPRTLQGLNDKEVMREIFGALGYQDGQRFFKQEEQEDPRIAQMQQELQMLQQKLQSKEIESQTKIQVEQIRGEALMQKEQLKAQLQMELKQMDMEIDRITAQLSAERNDISRGQLILQKESIMAAREQKQLEIVTNEKYRMSELLMKKGA